jgi:hypothetical protein
MRSLLAVLLLFGCRTPAKVAPVAVATAPVKSPTAPMPTNDELCRADGYDFAFDLPEAAAEGFLECGRGPGTPCDGPRHRCDGHTLLTCQWGKTTSANCRTACRGEIRDVNNFYDDGTCAERDGVVTCACCSVGEPGCTTEPNHRRPITTPMSTPRAPSRTPP